MNKYTEGVATVHKNIRKILRGRKRGYPAWEAAIIYAKRFGTLYSDSAISARFREMDDVKCNLSTYDYRLECK